LAAAGVQGCKYTALRLLTSLSVEKEGLVVVAGLVLKIALINRHAYY
jgi:hypothetical protein